MLGIEPTPSNHAWGLSTRTHKRGYGIARTILQVGERGGNRTHIIAVLQTTPSTNIENSPIESSGKGGFGPPHKVLETFMLPLTSFAYLKLVGHKGIEPLSDGP